MHKILRLGFQNYPSIEKINSYTVATLIIKKHRNKKKTIQKRFSAFRYVKIIKYLCDKYASSVMLKLTEKKHKKKMKTRPTYLNIMRLGM